QRNSEATKYGEVPENMLTKERQFRADISHLEQTLFKDKTDNQSLKDSLFSVKNKYQNYLTTIEKSHPKYYALKYKSDVVSLKKMQAEMQDNQLFLSYLVADEVLFLTTIENNKKAFYKLPFSQKTKNLITKLYKKSAKIDINDPSIYKDSYAVYKSILAPILSKTKATDLTICADDILNYLPFDALMTSDENQDYLLKSHAISYTSSATLFVEQSKKRNTKKSKLLVFAPKFTETTTVSHDRNNFSPLIYNEQEAKNISQYFSGTVYNGNNASIVNFKKELATHNLLHFATHASANDAFPDYSYLAFSDDKKTSNLLYVKDIYNYQINADLVTLSACETGVGKLQKGEGMMSLARAFNYAGVPSIVTTLWKINDQSTSEIMEYFYKNLYNGLSKKEALRQAKLSYLELCDDPILKHPYYWSGIVLTGNTDPVASKSMLIWLLLGTFVLILIRAVVRKRKAK
ncbi:MAG: CHAT domain-containing protein, partial [Flavobacteriaceae bacterium]